MDIYTTVYYPGIASRYPIYRVCVTRFRPVAARSLVARGERSVLALTSRSAAPATQTCEGSSSTGAHRRRASQRRLVGGLLSWTALDLPLLLLFIVVARIGIYQFNQRQIFRVSREQNQQTQDSQIQRFSGLLGLGGWKWLTPVKEKGSTGDSTSTKVCRLLCLCVVLLVLLFYNNYAKSSPHSYLSVL